MMNNFKVAISLFGLASGKVVFRGQSHLETVSKTEAIESPNLVAIKPSSEEASAFAQLRCGDAGTAGLSDQPGGCNLGHVCYNNGCHNDNQCNPQCSNSANTGTEWSYLCTKKPLNMICASCVICQEFRRQNQAAAAMTQMAIKPSSEEASATAQINCGAAGTSGGIEGAGGCPDQHVCYNDGNGFACHEDNAQCSGNCYRYRMAWALGGAKTWTQICNAGVMNGCSGCYMCQGQRRVGH